MNSDDNRKRKAAQAGNTLSKKRKLESPTPSQVVTPTRPTTRSATKQKHTTIAPAYSPRRRDPSPGPSSSASQSTVSSHRTRSQTGSLKSKKRPRSPVEDRTPPLPSGLSQWFAETKHKKLFENANSASPETPLSTKTRLQVSSQVPQPEDIIVISSDDDNSRPQKRTRRRHTTQVSEIIDLSKDDIPLPKLRPKTTLPKSTTLPTPVASPSIPTSPSKYLDLRRLSFSKPKLKATPRSQPQSQSQTPLKTKLAATPSPAELRRKRLNDIFADDDDRGSPADQLPAVEVVNPRRKSTSTDTSKTKPKSRPTQRIQPEHEKNSSPTMGKGLRKGLLKRGSRMFLSQEIRARLQQEEEEEQQDVFSAALPINDTTGNANVDERPAQMVIKLEDVEDTYIDYQSSMSNLDKEEGSVVKETQIFEPSPGPAQMSSVWADEQEQNDLEEAIYQSMLVASALEVGVPPENQEGQLQFEVEGQDSVSPVPTVSSSFAPTNDMPSVEDSALPKTQVALEEAERVSEEKADTEAPTGDTAAPLLDLDTYLDLGFELQEQDDLEEALLQSQLATMYSPETDGPISKREDEDMDENQRQEGVDAAAPPAPTANPDPYEEDVFVVEDIDDPASTITIPVAASTDDQIVLRPPSNEKDEEKNLMALGQMLFPELSAPLLPQVAAPCPFSGSTPTTPLANLVPTQNNQNTTDVFIAGQLTQRFFAQSCLPPKAKTRATKPAVMEGKPAVVAKPVLEVLVQDAIQEMQKEEPLVELAVQSVAEDEVESPVREMQVEKFVEELSMESKVGEMEKPVLLDLEVPDAEEIMESEDMDVEIGRVDVDVEIDRREWNEDEDWENGYAAVSISSPGHVNGGLDVDITQLPNHAEVVASPSPKTRIPASPQANSDQDDDIGTAGDIQVSVTTATSPALASDTVPTHASEDLTQEAENGVHQTTDIDMIEPTLQPEFGPTSSEQSAIHCAEALEKDTVLSRVLLETIKGNIETPNPDAEVAFLTVPVEEADDEMTQFLSPQTSTPDPEVLSPIEDHNPPSSLDEDSRNPESTSESPDWIEVTDDDPSQWSADSHQTATKSTPEPLTEIERPGDAPCHKVLSPRVRTPEPFTDQIEDLIVAPSGPLPSSHPRMPTPEPLAQSNDASLPQNRPLDVSSPRLQTSTPFMLEDGVGEGDAIGGTLKPELKDEGVQLPPNLVSVQKSPSQTLDHFPINDETSGQDSSVSPNTEQPGVHSTVSIGDTSPLVLDPHRRTISNAHSESSLATSDDSPPPSTPSQSAFEAYYIRSTSPDDDLGLDTCTKLTDIPPFDLTQADANYDDYYLSTLKLSYPDVLDIAG